METTAAPEAPQVSKKPIARKPLRVLHAVDSLGHGGVEMWLIQLLHAFDPRRVQMDFVVLDEAIGDLASEAFARGAEIHTCRETESAADLRHDFADVLYDHGPFDAVHSHLEERSGPLLEAAADASVPGRILHAYTVPKPGKTAGKWTDRIQGWSRKRNLTRHVTHGFAASDAAADAMFGDGWDSREDRDILPPAISLAAFKTAYGDQDARLEFGFTAGNQVIGHIGRFSEAKNHAFLLEVAETVIRWRPEVRFLLVGDGPLRAEIEADCERRGLNNFVVFARTRGDTVRLLTGVMDAFVYPSAWTGLPTAILEAQAAGLPIVGSTAIPERAVVNPRLVKLMPLDEGSSQWAESLLAAVDSEVRSERAAAIDALATSPFAVERSAMILESVYREGRRRKHGRG